MVIYYFLIILILVQNIDSSPEHKALMIIKSSLDPHNKILTSWTGDGDPCSGSFIGVACNLHHKVANISLQGKGLTGKLSPAVAELKCLSGLYLHYNFLYGEIPKDISNLTELSDLYLNMNNFSGTIPPQIGNMASLQVLELCCNHMTGTIPTEVGLLKKLNVLSLQHNQFTGPIPVSLGNFGEIKRLDLSFNNLSGPIPVSLAIAPQLEALYVQNNTLSGIVPSALNRLNARFKYENNPGLCGDGLSSLRGCTSWDDQNINPGESYAPLTNNTARDSIPNSGTSHCNKSRCSKSSKFSQIGIVAGVVTLVVTLVLSGFLFITWYRRRKQKIGNRSDTSDDRLSLDQVKEFKRIPSPLVSLDYRNGWGISDEFLHSLKFNVEEVESATHYFSKENLLGKSKFSAVYRGRLKDGSVVAVKSINANSCKPEESEFMKGLSLLTSLKHENLVRVRGFCCSKGRGECFLIYDFASKGNLSKYLDVGNGRDPILDWSTRVSIITGIAKGIEYLHRCETNKAPIIHQNISVEKILLDQNFSPLIMDSGLLKILADDVIFSALKVSAAMGYMAPEYITTGRFTEKSDVYAFGVIILQILSGQTSITNSIRLSVAETYRFDDLIDVNLKNNFSENEADNVTKIALHCTSELPECRPTMEAVVQELSNLSGMY